MLIVLTNSSLEEQLRVNEWCRSTSPNIVMIEADVRGLYDQIFTDFGSKLNVVDTTGKNPLTAIVVSITSETTAVVTTLDATTHDLEDGDVVTFSEVQGMTEINEKELSVKILGFYTFSIGDALSLGQYERGGVVLQVKQPKVVSFKPLSLAMKELEMLLTDVAKFLSPQLIHVCYQTPHSWKESHDSPPRPCSESDATRALDVNESVTLAKEKHGEEVTEEAFVFQFAILCSGELGPVFAAMGECIVTQEVMKACSGKFMPIFDTLACLPKDCSSLTEENCALSNSRYDGQIALSGKKLHESTSKQKWFVAGAGAIGCELLKIFALRGLICNQDAGGKVLVTDMIMIEKNVSNGTKMNI